MRIRQWHSVLISHVCLSDYEAVFEGLHFFINSNASDDEIDILHIFKRLLAELEYLYLSEGKHF